MIEEDIRNIIRFLDENFPHDISQNSAEPWDENCKACGESRFGSPWCKAKVAKVEARKET